MDLSHLIARVEHRFSNGADHLTYLTTHVDLGAMVDGQGSIFQGEFSLRVPAVRVTPDDTGVVVSPLNREELMAKNLATLKERIGAELESRGIVELVHPQQVAISFNS
jgi:hypothetical protein